jgi:hypothetical protein
MTTQEKRVNRKLSIIELAEFLKNVSQACRTNGVSRQHFYDIKKTYDEYGIEGLKEKSCRKPCIKNRVAPEIEDAVINMSTDYPYENPNKCLAFLESLRLSAAKKEIVCNKIGGIFGVTA